MTKLRQLLGRKWEQGKWQAGQAYVEYMLVVVTIAIVAIVLVAILGHRVSDLYNNVSNQLPK